MNEKEHYITAMAATGYALNIACRCGWIKFSVSSSESSIAWREHTRP